MFGHYLIAGETVDIGERWPELKEAKTIKEAQAQLRVGLMWETACTVLLRDLVENIARIAHRTVLQCQAAVPILFVARCGIHSFSFLYRFCVFLPALRRIRLVRPGPAGCHREV